MSTLTAAKPQDENPMLAMIRAMATFDAHHLVETLQKWLPQSAVPVERVVSPRGAGPPPPDQVLGGDAIFFISAVASTQRLPS